MSDSPEHWAQIATACDAIRRHGGTTELRRQPHQHLLRRLHPALAWRLVNLIRANEDDIYRMGRTRRSPRNAGYNRPLPARDPGPAWTDSYQATAYQGGREAMINFFNAFQSSSGRIEFRFPDASHDAGVIQAQVNLCAAMTNYVRSNDVPAGTDRPLHAARRGGWARNLMVSSPIEFEERTRPIRTLIDTLFSHRPGPTARSPPSGAAATTTGTSDRDRVGSSQSSASPYRRTIPQGDHHDRQLRSCHSRPP